MTAKGAGFWQKHGDDSIQLKIESPKHSGAPGVGRPDGAPDWIYEPTRTINSGDPRTSRIEYYKSQRKLYVEWGDNGTPYVYSEVTPQEAGIMRRVKSPGRYINRALNSHEYGPV